MTNNFRTNLKERHDPQNRWEIYDRFPIPVKRALENAPVNYAISSIVPFFSKYTIKQIVEIIEKTNAKIIPIVPKEHKKPKIWERVAKIKELQK